MQEKAIKKYNHVDVLTPMVYAFNLSGCRLMVFAYIQGFCRDETSVCYSSLTRIAETIGYARRTVAETINALIQDGFIYKIGTSTVDGQKVNGYRTYFYELMDRYDAGEEIGPSLLKKYRPRERGSAQCALVHFVPEGSAQNSAEVVHIVPEGSAQNSTQDNTMIKLNNNLSNSAHARAEEDEEREIFKIFFLRNAGRPAEEAMRFAGYYQSKGWADTQGRKYDTPEKRKGLAMGWECKSGARLPAGELTDNFYKFLRDFHEYAKTEGGIDPYAFISTDMAYTVDPKGEIVWKCPMKVMQWVEAHLDFARTNKARYFGSKPLIYETRE